jgi:adenylate kinase
MKNLILVGAPGSGKGTQSQKLKDLGYIHLSMGDLLRTEIASGSQLGKEIEVFTSGGNFVSDELALKLFKQTVQPNSQYIFDGFPRTINQAKAFAEAFKDVQVIFFELSLDDLNDRLVYRRTCGDCGAIYNLKTNPPKINNMCDCGSSKLQHRDDDKAELVAVRWKNFTDKTMPLLDVLKDAGYDFCSVNATNSEDQIFNDVLKFINK